MERGLELDGGDSAVSSWWGWREAKEMEFGGLWERKGSGVLGFGEKPQEWHLRGEEKAIWRVAREDGGRAWKTVRTVILFALEFAGEEKPPVWIIGSVYSVQRLWHEDMLVAGACGLSGKCIRKIHFPGKRIG